MPIKFDSSWEYGIFSLWGWLCCSKASSDNGIRNEIKDLYDVAKAKVPMLRKNVDQKCQRAIMKREWSLLIKNLENEPITYAEGLAKRDLLFKMVLEIDNTLMTEAAEASNAKASAAKASAAKPSKVKDDYEDDDAFADHYAGPTSITATRPIRTQPSLPPTQAELWTRAQGMMQTHCAEVASRLQTGSRASSGFGAHSVPQPAVLQRLPSILNATWEQGRPNTNGDEVRVFVAKVNGKVVRKVWSNGLSHADTRSQGRHTVYEQKDDAADFTRRSSAKHPHDPNP